MNTPHPGRITVVGAGMVAHRFVEQLIARAPLAPWSVTVIGDEPYLPYDRVHLSDFFADASPADLALNPTVWDDERVTLITGDAVTAIDRDAARVTTKSGLTSDYDHLVLATGSWAWTPRAEGTDLPGVFNYRTMDDVIAMKEWAETRSAQLGRALRGVVVGGGLLGLEAGAALQGLGAHATVVEFADRLMNVQLDDGGGEALRVLINGLGMDIRTSTGATALGAAPDGPVATMALSDESELPADIVVFSTGIRPRDRIAREAGLAIGERGGVVVGPTCRTSDHAVWAIGECASFEGETTGLVAPGNAMADVVVGQLLGGDGVYATPADGASLKGVGVDAASFGDVFALAPGALEVTFADPVARTYKKLVVSDDAKILLGGVFVGDTSLYPSLRPMLGRALGADPSAFLAPEGGAPVPSADLPDDVIVCSCVNVTAGTIREAVTVHGCMDVAAVKECTKAGTICVRALLDVASRTLRPCARREVAHLHRGRLNPRQGPRLCDL